MSERRSLIISLFKCGIKPTEISKRFSIPRTTVFDAIKRYKQLNTLQDRPRSDRPKFSDIKSVHDKLRLRLKRNPQRSMRKLAIEINVNRETLRKIAKNVFKVKPYKLQKAHLLTGKMKQQRLKISKNLLKLDAIRQWKNIVFSDEKLFTVQQSFNSQNDRIWSKDLSVSISNARIVSRSQKPASIMVWAAITSNGKTPLHFVDPGVKIDQKYYRNCILEGTLLPWARHHFGNKQWVFQQDSAPSHRAKLTQTWCRDNLPAFINYQQWPSYSPDANPLDYSVWSILESKACAKSHKNLESLKRDLVSAWNEIDEETLRRICEKFPERLKAIVKAKGGHIEK